MKRIVLALGIAALLGAFAVWWFSPVQVVKRRTLALLETLTLDPGGGSTRRMRAYSLNALLAPVVELNTPALDEANGSFERAELESAFDSLCQHAKQTRFELRKFHSIRASGGQADVSLTLLALVELQDHRPADGIYQAAFRWRRVDGVWRLARADWDQAAR
jgi:hypothetical protein